MWEEGIDLAKELVCDIGMENDDAWQQFSLEHWERTRIKIELEHFHQVPHAGKAIVN